MRDKSRSITALALLAVMFGLAACNPEPTCDKAADRVLELIDQQNQKMLAKFPEGQRKQLAEITSKSLPRERLVEDCKSRFTPEQIACTLAAKTLEDVSKCNQAAAPTGEPAPPTDPGEPMHAEPSPPAQAAPSAPAQAEPSAVPAQGE